MRNGMTLTGIRALVLDMDGVLWRGNEALPGLVAFFDWLKTSGKKFVLASNNSTYFPEDYLLKLETMGVTGVLPSQILTSATATASYLLAHYPVGTRVFVVGMDGLRRVLTNAGFTLVDERVEIVVVGGDFEFTYAKAKQATLLIRGGAAFIGTNPDVTFPTPEGLVPGAGSIIAMITAATGKTPLLMGKPEPALFEAALRVLDELPEHTLMVGDRLDTDIFGAYRAGLRTALMLTGVSHPDDLADSPIQPDAVFETLDTLRLTLNKS
jgi:4-nitrophenyl phosphatase